MNIFSNRTHKCFDKYSFKQVLYITVLCYQHSIKKRPTYEYYKNGKLIDPSLNDFTSGDDIIKFMDKKIKNKDKSESEDKVKDEL